MPSGSRRPGRPPRSDARSGRGRRRTAPVAAAPAESARRRRSTAGRPRPVGPRPRRARCAVARERRGQPVVRLHHRASSAAGRRAGQAGPHAQRRQRPAPQRAGPTSASATAGRARTGRSRRGQRPAAAAPRAGAPSSGTRGRSTPSPSSGEHGRQHGQRARAPPPRRPGSCRPRSEENIALPARNMPAIATTTVTPGDDHGPAGGRARRSRPRPARPAGGPLLALAPDVEQRVVDADREPDEQHDAGRSSRCWARRCEASADRPSAPPTDVSPSSTGTPAATSAPKLTSSTSSVSGMLSSSAPAGSRRRTPCPGPRRPRPRRLLHQQVGVRRLDRGGRREHRADQPVRLVRDRRRRRRPEVAQPQLHQQAAAVGCGLRRVDRRRRRAGPRPRARTCSAAAVTAASTGPAVRERTSTVLDRLAGQVGAGPAPARRAPTDRPPCRRPTATAVPAALPRRAQPTTSSQPGDQHGPAVLRAPARDGEQRVPPGGGGCLGRRDAGRRGCDGSVVVVTAAPRRGPRRLRGDPTEAVGGGPRVAPAAGRLGGGASTTAGPPASRIASGPARSLRWGPSPPRAGKDCRDDCRCRPGPAAGATWPAARCRSGAWCATAQLVLDLLVGVVGLVLVVVGVALVDRAAAAVPARRAGAGRHAARRARPGPVRAWPGWPPSPAYASRPGRCREPQRTGWAAGCSSGCGRPGCGRRRRTPCCCCPSARSARASSSALWAGWPGAARAAACWPRPHGARGGVLGEVPLVVLVAAGRSACWSAPLGGPRLGRPSTSRWPGGCSAPAAGELLAARVVTLERDPGAGGRRRRRRAPPDRARPARRRPAAAGRARDEPGPGPGQKLDDDPDGARAAARRGARRGQAGPGRAARPRPRAPPGGAHRPRPRRRAVGAGRPLPGPGRRRRGRRRRGRRRPSRRSPTSSSPRRSPTSPSTPGPTRAAVVVRRRRRRAAACGSRDDGVGGADARRGHRADRPRRPGRRRRRRPRPVAARPAGRPSWTVELPCAS